MLCCLTGILAGGLGPACGDDDGGQNQNQSNENGNENSNENGNQPPGDAGVEDCGDERDNDGDGFVDCNDADCVADPGCAGRRETACGDGADNDGDGLIDCADPNCDGVGACEVVEASCDDGVDNDGDGFADCNDADCAGLTVCQGRVETACDDGADDDGDGLVDCADPNCDGVGTCEAVEASCDDDLDNDGDGEVDCADADCAGVAPCDVYETVCNDGLDDEGDGDIDCADSDCTGSVYCGYPETRCDDGLDNDGDGLTDCADPHCVGLDDCESPEVSCDDGFDNDADGDLDCADPDCDGVGGCEQPEATCDDGLDNDADGDLDCADPDCDGDPCGPHGLQCQGGGCACPGGETTELSCGDSADNDCDGDSDCADPDCFGAAGCASEALCADGQDNDADGAADCADADCDGVGSCEQPEATCDDGLDNDGDGDPDCADVDCAGGAPCEPSEATCDDGFDNDGDGDLDCVDADCEDVGCGPHGLLCQGGGCVCPHGAGTEINCGDGVDNDCNGDTDCADASCSGGAFCTRSGETCASALPLSGTGVTLGDTGGAAADLDPGSAGCTGQPAAGADRVYQIDLQAGQRLTATVTPGASWDAALYVTSGCADLGSQCLAGADSSGGGGGTAGAETVTLRAGVTGTYFVVVDGRGAADAGAFTLEVTITEAGDTCADAPQVTQSTSVQASTAPMMHDYDPSGGGGGCVPQPVPGPDRVYAISLSYGLRLTATLDPAGWDGALYLLGDCAAPQASCRAGVDSQGSGGTETLTYVSDVAAETLYLVVDGLAAGGGGSFTLDIDLTEAGNDDCSLPTLLPTAPATYQGDLTGLANDYDPTVGTSCINGAAPGPDAVYRLTLDANETLTATLLPTGNPGWDGVLYVMTDGCADPSACAAGADAALENGQEVLSYTATANAEQVHLVVDALTTGTTFTLQTHVFVQGDDCASAIPVFGTSVVSDTTAGRTHALDVPAGCLAGGSPGPDAVYRIDLGAGQWLYANLVPSGWDGLLWLSGPGCGAGAPCLAAADAAGSGGAETIYYRAPTSPQTVYLVVDSALAGDFGDYDLYVGDFPPQVLLSEVFYDVAGGADDGLEWVEIHNADRVDVDLSDFSLGFGGADYTTAVHDLSGSLAPGQCVVIGGPQRDASNYLPTYFQSLDLGGASFNLENAEGGVADGVALFARHASEVTAVTVPQDAVIYGASNASNLLDAYGATPAPHVGAAPAGQSIQRDLSTDQWSVNPAPSPGTCVN
jgi:hypothetical protein